jgi:hypothetical protein
MILLLLCHNHLVFSTHTRGYSSKTNSYQVQSFNSMFLIVSTSDLTFSSTILFSMISVSSRYLFDRHDTNNFQIFDIPIKWWKKVKSNIIWFIVSKNWVLSQKNRNFWKVYFLFEIKSQKRSCRFLEQWKCAFYKSYKRSLKYNNLLLTLFSWLLGKTKIENLFNFIQKNLREIEKFTSSKAIDLYSASLGLQNRAEGKTDFALILKEKVLKMWLFLLKYVRKLLKYFRVQLLW